MATQTLLVVTDAEKADAKVGTREGAATQIHVLVVDAEKADAKAGIGEVEATQTFVLVAYAEKADAKAGTGEVEDFDPKVGNEMVDLDNQSKTVRIGKGLIEEFRCQLT